MTQYKKDMLSALIFFLIGIAVLVCTPATIIQEDVKFGVSARTFPYFIGGCMTALSLLLGVITYTKQRKAVKAGTAEKEKEYTDEEKKANRANELRAFLTAVVCILYAWVFDKVNFFISTFVLITALLAIFKVKKLSSYLICYAATVVIWACFTYFFAVRLP